MQAAVYLKHRMKVVMVFSKVNSDLKPYGGRSASYHLAAKPLTVIVAISCVLFMMVVSNVSASNKPVCKRSDDLSFYFNQAGQDWESETLPIGNGAMGASVLGGVSVETIQFSEKTLWTGGPGSKQGYDFGIASHSESYPERIKAVQKRLKQETKLTPELVANKLGRASSGYGSYQSFANIQLEFSHNPAQISAYKRSLNIKNAIAAVEYDYQHTHFKREYFVSYPDQVIAVKLSSDKAKQIDVSLDLDIANNRTVHKTIKRLPHSLNRDVVLMTASGKLLDNQLAYSTNMAVIAAGGAVSMTTQKISVSGADSVWLVVSAGTDYALNYPSYRGKLEQEKLIQRVSDAVDLGYEQLKKRHIDDYQSLFNRVALTLNHCLPQQPIDQLLAHYKANTLLAKERRALEALYYQFGRYLLIASSRKGSLPANLQGVWNNYEQAPWNSDYHININLQMNYWLADATNLSELNTPLFDFIDALIAPGELSAKRIFSVDGWVLFLNTNIWGFSGLIDWPTAFWQPEGAAWIALHYYDHYLYNQDPLFLKQRAYPVLKKATQFWLNTLSFDDSKGTYMVSPSYSPEHGDFSVGAAMSQQIVSKLLASTLAAAKSLNDQTMVSDITAVLAKLDTGLKVGSWGQLQEWQQDWDDKLSQHRHVSHLFALHPGNTISPLFTPALAKAAKTTLLARGDQGTGWSKAWKINFWARLFDGDHAHQLLQEQLNGSTLKNLWGNHPPFQIDGNLGATAGITEMLLQSQNQEIHVLPALPSDWPMGSITGLKARGNITVSFKWANHQLTHLELSSAYSQAVVIRAAALNGKTEVLTRDGKTVNARFEQGVLQFEALKAESYQLKL